MNGDAWIDRFWRELETRAYVDPIVHRMLEHHRAGASRETLIASTFSWLLDDRKRMLAEELERLKREPAKPVLIELPPNWKTVFHPAPAFPPNRIIREGDAPEPPRKSPRIPLSGEKPEAPPLRDTPDWIDHWLEILFILALVIVGGMIVRAVFGI